jgi:hypothetical protein
MKKEHMWGLAGLVIGVIAANKIRTLPGLSKLPSV